MRIETAFVCDDVRREDNGKLIFVGCYAGDIVLGATPTVERPIQLPLNLVICGDLTGATEIEVEVSLNAKVMLKGKLKATINHDSFSFLIAPLPTLIFTASGEMVIKAKLPVGKWKEIRKIQIKSAVSQSSSISS